MKIKTHILAVNKSSAADAEISLKLSIDEFIETNAISAENIISISHNVSKEMVTIFRATALITYKA